MSKQQQKTEPDFEFVEVTDTADAITEHANALGDAFTTGAEQDRDGEPANVTDAMFELARALNNLANVADRFLTRTAEN